MSKSFKLKILAADKAFYEGPAVSIIVPAADGDFQILAGHESIVLATTDGVVRFKTSDEEDYRRGVVSVGFVNVTDEGVTMLVDSAERPEDIDRARAEAALERAKEQLRQDQSIQEYRISKASLARAMNRLSESSRLNGLD